MGQDFWPVELPLPFAVLFRLLKSYGPETIFISPPTVEDLRTPRCVDPLAIGCFAMCLNRDCGQLNSTACEACTKRLHQRQLRAAGSRQASEVWQPESLPARASRSPTNGVSEREERCCKEPRSGGENFCLLHSCTLHSLCRKLIVLIFLRASAPCKTNPVALG